jgi:hypothetical protein
MNSTIHMFQNVTLLIIAAQLLMFYFTEEKMFDFKIFNIN